MDMVCEKHGPYKGEVLEIFGMKVYSSCPVCEAERMAEEEREESLKAERRRRQDLMGRGVEPEFFAATFASYHPETESEREALQGARDLDEGRIEKLLLLGDYGTGKTHLADVLVMRSGGIRVTMFEIGARIRAGYNEGRSDLDELDRLLSYPLIVIDEIGRTKCSDAERNWMSYLVDKAHVRGIRMVFVSNFMPASEGRRAGAKTFEDCLPDDVISRMRQRSRLVVIHGRDRRAGR